MTDCLGGNNSRSRAGQDLVLQAEADNTCGYQRKGHFLRHPYLSKEEALSLVATLSVEAELISPEGSVEGAGELCRVRHESAPISQASVHETKLDRPDSSIHHVTGSDAMCSSFGIIDSNFSDALNGRWGVNGSILMKNAAVTMRGVFAKTNVDCNVEFWEKSAKFLGCLDNWSLGIVSRGSAFVLKSEPS